MTKILKKFLPCVLLLASTLTFANQADQASVPTMTPEVGKTLPTFEFDGKNGSTVAGETWKSTDLPTGKVISFMYVDPDAKEWNLTLEDAMKKAAFPKDKYQSVATINMKATWLPNFAISKALKDKQKLYPDTLYLQDMNKFLVEKWGLQDDSYHVLILGKQGQILYSKAGKLDANDIQQIVNTIRENL